MLFYYATGEAKLRRLAQVHGEQTKTSLTPQMLLFIFPLSDAPCRQEPSLLTSEDMSK